MSIEQRENITESAVYHSDTLIASVCTRRCYEASAMVLMWRSHTPSCYIQMTPAKPVAQTLPEQHTETKQQRQKQYKAMITTVSTACPVKRRVNTAAYDVYDYVKCGCL